MEQKQQSKTALYVFYLLFSFLFFALAAGGQVIFGPNFHGDILLAPAWGMFFVPFFYTLKATGIKALIQLIQAVAGGIAKIDVTKIEDKDNDGHN